MRESQPNIVSRISEKQMRLWHALHSPKRALQKAELAEACPYRFVTLSRDDGSLGDEIAQGLANRLGWHLFDKEIVNYIAENGHVREQIVQQLDEKSQGLVQEAILRLLRMPENASFGTEEYHDALMKTMATLATQGNAILVGRGANFALRWSEHGLHIRVTASLETRLHRVNEQWRLSPEKARQRLITADADRRNFIRHHYRMDIHEYQGYDLVINTDGITAEQAVKAIISVMIPEVALIHTKVS